MAAKVNKSQLVREYLEKKPGAKAMEVVDALKGMGHTITPNLVYYLKGKSSAKKRRKKAVVKAAWAASKHGSARDPVTLIREVRDLAERAGGYEKLKDLVDALAG